MATVELRGLTLRIQQKAIVQKLNLTIPSGKMFALLGPSGGGKTTTLRLIGGFLRPSEGQVLIDGEDVTQLTPERRPTSMVFQQYALWPHMTVWQNVVYGLVLRKLPKAEMEERVHEALTMVGLTGYERAYPAQLSGGQQQRVALARSLVLQPKVLLLDEPLSNLDAKLRLRVREEIREIQQRVGITTVLVTHDQDEALSIADQVAVLADGQIQQVGTPDVLYDHPRNQFVANFVGTMNWFAGRKDHNGVMISGRMIPVEMSLPVSLTQQELVIGVRPEDVLLTDDTRDPEARVSRIVSRGHFQEVVLTSTIGDIHVFTTYRKTYEAPIHFRFARCHLFTPEGEAVVERSNAAVNALNFRGNGVVVQ
ncbi:MAG: ABC transporter ATP-binding protein [Firmicutes bacterium]|nr:ABC transporter ATP-binding protein [Bacillota bacterium]